MAFQAIAYGPDEHCLLTIDGAELLAHDAQTESPKWQLTLAKRLSAVHFVDASTLPGCQGANPFRSQSTNHAALVVDVDGCLTVVDTSLGHSIGELGPFGKPLAIASSPSGAVALACDATVIVWRNAERTEVPIRGVRALAFSTDGATLAVGTDKGELRMFYIASQDPKAAPEQTLRSELGNGSISDITQHPNGTWVVACADGVIMVAAGGNSRLEKIPSGIIRVQFDSNGNRLAVQRSERGIVVYEWPGLGVLMRIEYTDRPVRGISFGEDNWLGVALDHGDGNKIDIVTTSVHRTDTHPGRTHRSWTLLVEGKKDILSAKEAEDIRRMKSPFEPEKTAPSSGSGLGGRIGIGAMISIALIGVRVCVRASSSSSSPSFNYNIPTFAPPTTCDRACAVGRMNDLKKECITADLDCADDVDTAVSALNAGNCAQAKSALARTSSKVGSGKKSPLFSSYQVLAVLGVDEACRDGSIRPRIVKHAQVVRLKTDKSPAMEPSIERIPEAASPTEGETPRALYVAPDGTLFVATTTAPSSTIDKWAVYRRKKAATTWEVIHTKVASSQVGRVSLFGRSASDVYVAADISLAHYDGTDWTEISTPIATVFSVNGSDPAIGDVLVAGGSTAIREVYRRRFISKGAVGGTWTREVTPNGILINDLFSNGTSNGAMWALGEDATSTDVILQRSAGGANATWAIKTPSSGSSASSDGGTTEDLSSSRSLSSMWISPTGHAFVATDESVLVSTNNGATWKTYDMDEPARLIWGRSSTDVFVSSSSGIVHFDGKTWSKQASHLGSAPEVMGGTATELILLRTADPPTTKSQ